MAIVLDYSGTHNGAPDGFFDVTSTTPIAFGQSATTIYPARLEVVRFILGKSDPPDGFTPFGQMRAYVYNTFSGTPGVDAVPTGSPYATSDPIDVSTLNPGYYAGYDFTFVGAQAKTLLAGTYIVVIDRYTLNGSFAYVGGNGVYVQTSGTHSGNGSSYTSANGWQPYSWDINFVLIGAPLLPTSDFTATPTTGTGTLNVAFTDTTNNNPTSWSWNFGDGGTSTTQNPTHTYASPGNYTVALTATNSYGSNTTTKAALIKVARLVTPSAIASTLSMGSPTIVSSAPAPPAETDWSAIGKEDEKVYVYKVYKHDGTYIGIWTDVVDELQFSQQINTPGTTTTVRLARSANTRKSVRTGRSLSDGSSRSLSDGDLRTVSYETSNSVGEDTDVDLNYNVDVYVHYGEFDERIIQNGEERITSDGDVRVAAVGAPLGTRVFSGFILDYESVYGSQAGVTVTLASHGFELSQEIIRSGTTTTIAQTAAAIETIAKNILDTNPGKMGYDAASIANTGTNVTVTFKLNTKLEGLGTLYDQTPNGWYWYGNVADNKVYLQPISTGFDHIFLMGWHIKELRIKRSIENLVNAVWFVGGDVSGTTVYKYYDDATSQTAWRKGIQRITDRRYKLATSMAARANKLMGRYKNPIFTSPITISSARYDIESIKLGATVGVRNIDNFIGGLPPLQIVSLNYTPTAVTLQLGELQERLVDIVSDVGDDLATEQYDTIPNAPS